MPDASILDPLGSLVGIVIVVWFFLNHITKSEKVHIESLKEISKSHREETMVQTEDLCRHLDKNSDVIDGNSRVLGETTTVLGQATEILRDHQRQRG